MMTRIMWKSSGETQERSLALTIIMELLSALFLQTVKPNEWEGIHMNKGMYSGMTIKMCI